LNTSGLQAYVDAAINQRPNGVYKKYTGNLDTLAVESYNFGKNGFGRPNRQIQNRSGCIPLW